MTKKEYDAKRYQAKKQQILEQSKAYYEANKEKVLKRHAVWRGENKEAQKKYDTLWRQKNRGKARAKVRNYQARKLKAMPAWAEVELIKQFYKNCPEGYEVDHIVPLQGKNVCGLHVLANLQYLPRTENRKKSNKF